MSPKLPRRRFLAKTAGTLSISGVSLASVGEANAKPSSNIYERSLELRSQENWSCRKWSKYLRKHGLDHGQISKTVSIPSGPDSSTGISTQGWEKHELTLFISCTYPRYSPFVVIDFDWSFNNKEIIPESSGVAPYDYAGIGWDNDHYTPMTASEPWVYYANNCGTPEKAGSLGSNGASSYFHGAATGEHDGYFGCHLDPNSAVGKDSRNLYFNYIHTWHGGKLTSIGVSTSGHISFKFSITTEQWVQQDVATESQLIDGEYV